MLKMGIVHRNALRVGLNCPARANMVYLQKALRITKLMRDASMLAVCFMALGILKEPTDADVLGSTQCFV